MLYLQSGAQLIGWRPSPAFGLDLPLDGFCDDHVSGAVVAPDAVLIGALAGGDGGHSVGRGMIRSQFLRECISLGAQITSMSTDDT